MKEVQEFIRKQNMIQEGDCVLAGVSGGADSMCLLLELLEFQKTCPFTLKVIHIEHGIRGEASLADARFVQNFCKKYQVPFQLYCFDVKKIAVERKQTVEEAGRRIRYETFESAAQKEANGKIAVAHNLDDQAETILMNLARGSGLRGLGGIRPVRGRVIRPLLNTTRKQIEAFLNSRGIGWRTDATNLEMEYTRNRIRLEILPLLTRYVNEQTVNHIAEAGIRLQRAEDYLQKQTEKLSETCVKAAEGKIYLRRDDLKDQERLMQEYLIRSCLGKLVAGQKDIGGVHMEALLKLVDSSGGDQMGRTVHNSRNFIVYRANYSGKKVYKMV